MDGTLVGNLAGGWVLMWLVVTAFPDLHPQTVESASMAGKIAAAVAGAFLLAGLEMFHSILDSLLAFGAIHTGDAPFGYLDWLGWFWWVTLLNVAGGLVLVTLLRLLRSGERIAEERSDADEGKPAPGEAKNT